MTLLGSSAAALVVVVKDADVKWMMKQVSKLERVK